MDRRVLIVDDEALFRGSLADALGALQPEVKVEQAGDGLRGWEIIESQPVDLLVTDIKMPRMDGFHLLQNLCNSHRDLPVIVVTAFGTGELEDTARRLGALHFVDKPVDLPALVGTIEHLLLRGRERSVFHGLSLAGFTQLLQIERKTCQLNIAYKGDRGVLLFSEGELTHADDGRTTGDAAALTILGWLGADIEMRAYPGRAARTVSASLTQLVLDALRILDEATPHESLPVTERSANPLDEWSELADVPPLDTRPRNQEKLNMIDIKSGAQAAVKIDGALGAAVVDYESGMCLAHTGSPGFDLELAAAGNADVVRAKKKIRDKLGLRDRIDDILITLTSQYHVIRMVGTNMFIYLVLDRQKANLAMARKELELIEKQMDVERR